ncbi:MAG: hypothetical protein J6Q31_07050 [Alistipes sp.]|nr:hypothetical protein [Alistipes sp.]
MKRFFRLTLLVIVFTAMVNATQAQYRFGGAMMDHDGMMGSDMFTLSQVNFGFGTARSMAMAGAFTSLGGDVASMGINPAGLGMYRSNDISFSPLMGFQNAENSAMSWGDNNQSRFAVSNLGVVLNLYENSKSKLVSVNFGFGYNRIADFNYRYGFSSESGASSAPYRSIADAFSLMMNQSGLFPETNDSALPYDFRDAYYWGGMLAYNNYLLDVGVDDKGIPFYTTADRLGVNAGVGHTANMQSRGSIGEYDISFGLNYNNKLYLGFTWGIQSVNWKRQIYYGEDYLYPEGSVPVYSDDGVALSEPVKWMDYNQAVLVNGTGMNAKIGLIYRPVEALRLGVAVHTPTFYALERSYQAYMATDLNPQGNTTPELEDFGENTWDFWSPTRLMFGASYAFGRFAVVSVDYERDWYNGMRVKNIPAGFDLTAEQYRQEFRDNYKGSNTLRIGAEVKPLPSFALRAGYGVASGALRNDKSWYYNAPQIYKTTCLSAGAGFAVGATTIDLSYQHINNKQTEYMLFYAMDNNGVFDTASPTYRTDLNRNYFTLTIGYRF